MRLILQEFLPQYLLLGVIVTFEVMLHVVNRHGSRSMTKQQNMTMNNMTTILHVETRHRGWSMTNQYKITTTKR